MKSIYLFIIFLFSFIKSKYLTIPFKFEFDYNDESSWKSEEEKIIEKLINPTLSITASIGTQPQRIKMNLNSTVFYMIFYSSVLNNERIKGFDTNSSTSYRKSRVTVVPKIDECSDISEFQEYLTISPDEIEPMNYFLPLCEIVKNDRKPYIRNGGVLGLDIMTRDYSGSYNIISCLKGRDNVRQYDYFFKYNSENEGYLYIGACQYNITSNETKDNYLETKAEPINGQLYWSFLTQIFQINDKRFDFTNRTLKAVFHFEEKMFTAPFMFLKIFKQNFFEEYLGKNKCFEKELNNYIYLYCDKSGVDYTKLKKVKFQTIQQYPFNSSFIFDYKDLFYEYNNKQYFLIRFHNKEDIFYLTFGQIFVKKYLTSFNQDTKSILLPYIIDPSENQKGEQTPTIIKKTNTAVIIVLVIIIILLLFVVIRFSYNRYIRKERKIRANELQDNYVYEGLHEEKD